MIEKTDGGKKEKIVRTARHWDRMDVATVGDEPNAGGKRKKMAPGTRDGNNGGVGATRNIVSGQHTRAHASPGGACTCRMPGVSHPGTDNDDTRVRSTASQQPHTNNKRHRRGLRRPTTKVLRLSWRRHPESQNHTIKPDHPFLCAHSRT